MRGRRAKLWLWHCLFLLGGEAHGREGGIRERERSRALCTSHLGDEKNETAAEKEGGRRGKRPNGVPFRINSPEWEEEQKRGREGGRGGGTANQRGFRFSRIMMKDHSF